MSKIQTAKGFTLIEVMVTVAIIGLLAAVALPNYSSYVQRGKITEATGTLSEQRVIMERWYQDNRDYGSTATTCGPALPTNGAFTYSCSWEGGGTDQSYTLVATGNAAGGMLGFRFTLNQNNARSTAEFPSATGLPKACWITKASENC